MNEDLEGTTDQPAVAARNITVHYGETVAVEDVTFTVPTGRICGLLGMNGSGKSTLYKAMMGLVRVETGEVRLLGRLSRAARTDGLIAYVPQTEAIDADFPVTVRDVVMMGRYGKLGISRRARKQDRAAVHDALERVGLVAVANNPIGALSGGQRKRAFLGRAIAQQAELLLLDEPFAGVDKRSETTITDLLHALRDEGRTIMISTHDLASVPLLCDEAILLHRKVIAHGSLDEVLAPETLGRAFGGAPLSTGERS